MHWSPEDIFCLLIASAMADSNEKVLVSWLHGSPHKCREDWCHTTLINETFERQEAIDRLKVSFENLRIQRSKWFFISAAKDFVWIKEVDSTLTRSNNQPRRRCHKGCNCGKGCTRCSRRYFLNTSYINSTNCFLICSQSKSLSPMQQGYWESKTYEGYNHIKHLGCFNPVLITSVAANIASFIFG